MQHYGAPTRLLDWTQSIYVAAYFACTSNFDFDGAVWVLHPFSLEEKMQKKFPGKVPPGDGIPIYSPEFHKEDAVNYVNFLEPGAANERGAPQQSRFSLCYNIGAKPSDVFKENLTRNSDQEIIKYLKIVIPKNSKIEFIKRLRIMNISAYSLFPGVDGLGRSVDESLIIRNFANS